jgi:4-hydroxy-tetrahydrodipicolinate reductase
MIKKIVSPLNICLAGANGWVGRTLVPAILDAEDLKLVSAVSISGAGKRLGEVLSIENLDIVIYRSVTDALAEDCDVLIDYTSPIVVKDNVLSAIKRKVNVVIGTSGLTDNNFDEIDEAARKNKVGVLAAGNFAITAVLLQRFAEIAARYIPHWEIIDYATDQKSDAPSGTARELASRLAEVRHAIIQNPVDKTIGDKESRGAYIHGMQVHSVRLPGFVLSAEAIFGLKDERLTIRHDAGNSAEPYVQGTLMAVRKVKFFTGLKRGLDSILEL